MSHSEALWCDKNVQHSYSAMKHSCHLLYSWCACLTVIMDWRIMSLCTVLYMPRCVCISSECTSEKVTSEERERQGEVDREGKTREGEEGGGGGGLGGPGHRWLREADVYTELFSVVPASSETVTEVHRANRLPQNGWLDLGKQMLKKCVRHSEMSPETVSRRKTAKLLGIV